MSARQGVSLLRKCTGAARDPAQELRLTQEQPSRACWVKTGEESGFIIVHRRAPPSEKLKDLGDIKEKWLIKKKDDFSFPNKPSQAWHRTLPGCQEQ